MKIKLILLVLLIIVSQNFAQPYSKHDKNPKERMEQLEKMKLLEVLNLNEEEAIRFFSRRNEFRDEHRELIQQREAVLYEIELALGKEKSSEQMNYKDKVKEFLKLEEKLLRHRENFLNSISDILTTEQVAKLVVFESKFKQEIRDALIKRRGRK